MNIIELDKNYMINELDLPYSAVEDVIIDTGRWSIYHEIVFEYEGKHYQTTYSEGATENQCEAPWEYESKVICTEVELKEVMVKKWVVKE